MVNPKQKKPPGRPNHHPGLNQKDVYRIAAEASCDPRTVIATLNGTARPSLAQRVKEAMKKLKIAAPVLVLLLVIFFGCRSTSAGPSPVVVWHDDARNVTCWYHGEAICCLPDRAWGLP